MEDRGWTGEAAWSVEWELFTIAWRRWTAGRWLQGVGRCSWSWMVLAGVVLAVLAAGSVRAQDVEWRHLSSKTGDIAPIEGGSSHITSWVLDVDGDGVNDFVLADRTTAPSVVWYRRASDGWTQYVVDADSLRIEAGSAIHDIDGDGDLDIVAGGDSRNNEVYWWENPQPHFDPDRAWTRRTIKNDGADKHHDQIFGDVDGDGEVELVFWNQKGTALFVSEIPENPRRAQSWERTAIYRYSRDSEMEQRGEYPDFRRNNDHEGLDLADIDGDGQLDIVGGGRWFKHLGGTDYLPNVIDASYQFTRSRAGQLIEGGRPDVLLVAGDGKGPLRLYEWRDGTWVGRNLIDEVDSGHTLDVLDFDGDGHLDIFIAEMRLYDRNPDAKVRILLGDGTGHFEEMVVSTGIGLHESRIADLDGDGDYDIVGKPHAWDTPRIDIWINDGTR